MVTKIEINVPVFIAGCNIYMKKKQQNNTEEKQIQTYVKNGMLLTFPLKLFSF